MNKLILALYSALMWCAQPVLRRKLVRRGQAEPGYLAHIEERFGYYTQPPSHALAEDQRYVWVHAVSLGETRVAGVLIEALRKRMPDMKLLLTHGTATGRVEGQRLLQPGDVQVWQAWDTPDAVQRFLTHFQPRIGILMETELYPNMAAICSKRCIPLVMANARLSEKTYVATSKLTWLAHPAYQSLTAVWAQSAADAQRFEALGSPVQGVFGNLKFDASVDSAQLAQGRAWRRKLPRPVLMFASSREGEELQLLSHLQKNRSNIPLAGVNIAYDATKNIVNNQQMVHQANAQVQWLIVPRHPQRFEQVADLIRAHGFNVSRRSAWSSEGTSFGDFADPQAAPTIWLGDSLGEMALYFGLSDVALLGGSFEPLGGQNLIEAAACGCPVVMGPSTFNFAEAAQLAVQAGAAIQVDSLLQAAEAAAALLETEGALGEARAASVAFAAANQGAADKTAAAIQTLLR